MLKEEWVKKAGQLEQECFTLRKEVESLNKEKEHFRRNYEEYKSAYHRVRSFTDSLERLGLLPNGVKAPA